MAESKFAANVSGFTPLIQQQDSVSIRTLLTNTTQEASVLAQANTAATAFASGWVTSGALVSSTFSTDLTNAAATVFRELIDITTEIEIEYVSDGFDFLWGLLLSGGSLVTFFFDLISSSFDSCWLALIEHSRNKQSRLRRL